MPGLLLVLVQYVLKKVFTGRGVPVISQNYTANLKTSTYNVHWFLPVR